MTIKGYDYGIIGNGRICALVSKNASIDWCCFPRFDSESIFAKILDNEKGGFFSIYPVNLESYKVTQEYIKNTNILSTVFSSPDHEFEIVDYIPCYNKIGYLYQPVEVHRIIRVKKGNPSVKALFKPAFSYGQHKTKLKYFSQSICAEDEETGGELYLHTNIPKDFILRGREFIIPNNSYFLLSCEKQTDSLGRFDIEKEFRLTKTYWHRWVQTCNVPEHYQKEIIRSALTLKLLIYEETGAILAAPTTSLPEIIGKDRNWDYRYCWLRDAYFVVNVLTKLSHIHEAERFIDYIKSTLIGNLEYVRPIYTIDGCDVPDEEIINLAGYCDSQPVRVGNGATNHYQDDVYGEVVLSLYPLFFDERFVREDLEEIWKLVATIVKIAIQRFSQTDQGIWEFRGEAKHYTFSKLMIWAAVDRGYKIALKFKKKEEAKKWKKTRDMMKQEILSQAWSDSLQSFTQSYEKKHLDASNLLIPALGLVDEKDDKVKKMIAAIERDLKVDDFVFRYTNQDDFGFPETAFLICSFWLVDALALSGQKDKARKYFERLIKNSNHLGLFSEDIDPKSKRLLGNFPQAYTHVAVINSALLLN